MASINGKSLERGVWAGVAVSAIIVLLRLYAKYTIQRIRFDDLWMLLALGIAIASVVFLTLSVQHGFGLVLPSATPHDQMLVLKYVNVQITTVTLCATSARTSFILYILGILGTKKIYLYMLWAILLIQLSGNIASAILPLVICRNPAILWDPTTKTTCGNINSILQFAYFTNTFNSAADLFLVVFSTWVFWNLNLQRRVKIMLIGLMSLGLIAMVASVIKTVMLGRVSGVTSLGKTGRLQVICWGYVEVIVIMTTSSIPCIRPLLVSSVRSLSQGGLSRSYRSYELGENKKRSNFSSTKSKHNSVYNKTPDLERDSVEQVLMLDAAAQLSSSGPTRPQPAYSSHTGITRKVEIEVNSDSDHELRFH